jgi:hypothetical protein
MIRHAALTTRPLQERRVQVCLSPRIVLRHVLEACRLADALIRWIAQHHVVRARLRQPHEAHAGGELFAVETDPEVAFAGVAGQELFELVEHRRLGGVDGQAELFALKTREEAALPAFVLLVFGARSFQSVHDRIVHAEQRAEVVDAGERLDQAAREVARELYFARELALERREGRVVRRQMAEAEDGRHQVHAREAGSGRGELCLEPEAGRGNLNRARVDVDAVQVVRNDALGNLRVGPAFPAGRAPVPRLFAIHREEQIEREHQK